MESQPHLPYHLPNTTATNTHQIIFCVLQSPWWQAQVRCCVQFRSINKKHSNKSYVSKPDENATLASCICIWYLIKSGCDLRQRFLTVTMNISTQIYCPRFLSTPGRSLCCTLWVVLPSQRYFRNVASSIEECLMFSQLRKLNIQSICHPLSWPVRTLK